MFFNHNTYSLPQEEKSSLDYKHFIREFESYRNLNSDQSFQEALNNFMQKYQQNKAENTEALV